MQSRVASQTGTGECGVDEPHPRGTFLLADHQGPSGCAHEVLWRPMAGWPDPVVVAGDTRSQQRCETARHIQVSVTGHEEVIECDLAEIAVGDEEVARALGSLHGSLLVLRNLRCKRSGGRLGPLRRYGTAHSGPRSC